MRKDKEKAIQLRQQGRSYKQIHKELGIGISTLASWFKDEPWSQNIKANLSAQVSLSNPRSLKLMVQANKDRWKNKHEEYRAMAIIEFNRHKDDPLFLAGIMLYWGEGEKKQKSSVVSLSNSEPEMVKLFNLFLTNVLSISSDKISASLLLYPDLVDSVQKNFWCKVTGLSLEQFKKSTYVRSRQYTKRLSYGVCTIFVNSRALKERMLKWIELYQNYFKSRSFEK